MLCRSTHHVGRKAISAIKQAPRTAAALDRPLNLFVSINIAHTDCPVEEISRQFGILRTRRFASWASYTPAGAIQARNGEPTFAWVIEAPNGHSNIHWLVHVKEQYQREFARNLNTWVDELFGTVDWSEDIIDIKPAATPAGAAKYMVKGADPKYAEFYWLTDTIEPQGLVYGKRGGVSQNLATTARTNLKRAGLIPRTSRYGIYPRSHPGGGDRPRPYDTMTPVPRSL